MRGFLANVPLFLPGVLLSLMVAILFARPVARSIRSTPAVAFLAILAVGGIVSATLTPGTEAIVRGIPSTGGCETDRVGLIPLSELLRVDDESLNVLLFIPLGIAIGLLPWSRRTAVILGAALLLPFIIELGQALVPALGRGCQTADMADNLTGLAIGLVIGTAAARIRVTM
jgi:glycopeptide antibiotics resistance protein